VERDELAILSALVKAHEIPHASTGAREPIMFLKHSGGDSLQHHALDSNDASGLDEAMVEDLHGRGLLDIDYREHNLNLRPTGLAKSVVAENERISDLALTADAGPIHRAVAEQLESDNPLAWPRVRPVLIALQRYWRDSGYSEHGIALTGILDSLPEEQVEIFKATVRMLMNGGFLDSSSRLSVSGIPGEVGISATAHSVLDGWPGATRDQLAENLLAVIASAVEEEDDPVEKKRLRKLGDTIREVGIATAGDVLARVMTGGA
jgi:hypothetical protein